MSGVDAKQRANRLRALRIEARSAAAHIGLRADGAGVAAPAPSALWANESRTLEKLQTDSGAIYSSEHSILIQFVNIGIEQTRGTIFIHRPSAG